MSKMGHWWRAYDECVDDPKLGKLSDRLHRAWFNLCCIASSHGGVLPPIADVAFKLRATEQKAAELIAALVSAGLFDRRPDGKCEPHNWEARQFKSDVSTQRVKRFRERHRNGEAGEGGAVSATPPDSENREQSGGGGGDARARPLVGPEAMRLADRLAEICGHGTDPKAFPPAWHGAPMRVQAWLSNGWHPDIILAAVREAVARKRDGPVETVAYFEKPIARAVARQAAPLPVATPLKPQETSHVIPTTGDGGSVVAAIRRIRAQLEEFDGPGSGRPADGHPVQRLPEG